jgi:hypothetical protein
VGGYVWLKEWEWEGKSRRGGGGEGNEGWMGGGGEEELGKREEQA